MHRIPTYVPVAGLVVLLSLFTVASAYGRFSAEAGAGPLTVTVVKNKPAIVEPGVKVQYAITVRNTGTQPVKNARAIADAPAGMTYVSGTSSCRIEGGVITCTNYRIKARSSKTWKLNFQVPKSTSCPGSISFAARAAADGVAEASAPSVDCAITCPVKKTQKSSRSSSASVAETPSACIPEGGVGRAIPPPGQRCCDGLVSVMRAISAADGMCIATQNGGFVCTKCGRDGRCGAGENSCNCRTDCSAGSTSSRPSCTSEGGIVSEATGLIRCCAGLTSVPNIGRMPNGLCTEIALTSVCVQCGDGQCGTGETACNCPQDCSS